MAETLHLVWEASLEPGLPRRDRRSCEYEAYVPDPLQGRRFSLDGDVAAEVAEAEAKLSQLDLSAASLANTEILARLLLRAESLASSKIEGLEVGGRRLALAEAARELGGESHDVTADEVLGNIEAMAQAATSVRPGGTISVDTLLRMHKRLLSRTRLSPHAGMVRTEQNWIGGSDFHPCSADFVPPPHDIVSGLLDDLCAFCNDDSLPVVAQAAIAHAQFETIHPFVDGNGRIGRALIHLVLRRRGLTSRVFAPVSLILATWSRDYVRALTRTRYLGPPDSPEAHDGLNGWMALFAAACKRAVEDAFDFEQRMHKLEDRWRAKLGQVRSNSAADLLLRELTSVPLITVNNASRLIGRSFEATNKAISQLVIAKILTPVTLAQRNRAFEAKDTLKMFTDLERRLASPTGDTRASGPSRRVPRRHVDP